MFTEVVMGRCATCRVYVEREELRKTAGVLHCVGCPPLRVAPPPARTPTTPSPARATSWDTDIVDFRRPSFALTLPPGFKQAAYVVAATIGASFIAACASQL